jgi:hypothetical protein
MTKDNPWAGISDMGAIDQKLYQKHQKTDETAVTVATNNVPPEATFENEEMRMTLPLPSFTVDTLTKLEKDIFKKRSKENRARVRVTKNSVARAWLKLLENVTIDINNVADEEDLYIRMKKAINL